MKATVNPNLASERLAMSDPSGISMHAPSRARYYTPISEINVHPGVKKSKTPVRDVYVGSAEDLFATGIVTMGMLPGREGMPTTSATFRPAGVVRDRKDGWYGVPGHMQIVRRAAGRFEVSIRVSKQEEERRERRLRDSMPPHVSREATLRKLDAESSLRFDTPEKFRSLLSIGQLHSSMASGDRFLFRLSDKDLVKLRDLESQMQQVIDHATVLERPGVRKAKLAALAAVTCAPFQHMLRRLEGSGADAGEAS